MNDDGYRTQEKIMGEIADTWIETKYNDSKYSGNEFENRRQYFIDVRKDERDLKYEMEKGDTEISSKQVRQAERAMDIARALKLESEHEKKAEEIRGMLVNKEDLNPGKSYILR